MAPADGEKGLVLPQRLPAQGDLKGVALRDHALHHLVRRLPVEAGVHVGAARQEQPVHLGQELGRVLRPSRNQYHGEGPRRLHRPHVVVAQREHLTVLGGVADGERGARPRSTSMPTAWPSASSLAKMLRARTMPFWM